MCAGSGPPADRIVAYFDETAKNMSAWDRAVGWCEHGTMGPPFLDKGVAMTGASITRGRAGGACRSGLDDGKWSHAFRKPHPDNMRNYLWRCV